mgnify:CR=1 FL=1
MFAVSASATSQLNELLGSMEPPDGHCLRLVLRDAGPCLVLDTPFPNDVEYMDGEDTVLVVDPGTADDCAEYVLDVVDGEIQMRRAAELN